MMMDNPPEERPVTIPLSLSVIIYVYVVSVSEMVTTFDTFYFCTKRKFKMTTRLQKKPFFQYSCPSVLPAVLPCALW